MLTVHKAQVGREVLAQIRLFGRRDHLTGKINIPMTRKSSALFWTSTKMGVVPARNAVSVILSSAHSSRSRRSRVWLQSQPLLLLVDVGQ